MEKKILYLDNYFPTLDEFKSILVPHGVEVIDAQCQNEQDAVEMAHDVVGIVTSDVPVGETLLSAAPKLKIVVRQAAGIEILDIKAASRRNVMVCNIPDYCRHEVAEHTIALLMALSRKILVGYKCMLHGQFDYKLLRPIYSHNSKTLGFIGFGGIAQMVATKLSGFQFNIKFFDPYIKISPIQGAIKTSLEDLLKTSDSLLVHAPETPETHHILNSNTLSLMKPTALIVNTSRGGLIDTPALIEMLTDGRLAGAALDVVEGEHELCPGNALCQMENVILTPHYGWYSEDSMKKLEIETAMELSRALQGLTPKNLLNPEVIGPVKIGDCFSAE